jgi:hypothetical protein
MKNIAFCSKPVRAGFLFASADIFLWELATPDLGVIFAANHEGYWPSSVLCAAGVWSHHGLLQH